jgi:hypothetical protein
MRDTRSVIIITFVTMVTSKPDTPGAIEVARRKRALSSFITPRLLYISFCSLDNP